MITVAVVAVGIVVALVVGLRGPAVAHPVLLWVVEKSTAVSARLPDAVRAVAHSAAAGGGGTLRTLVVGARATELPPTSLAVERLGATEADPRRRDGEVDRRLAELDRAVDGADVGVGGFSIAAALQAMSDVAVDGPVEAWFSTSVLSGSVDPLRMAALTAADPGEAVHAVADGPVGRISLHDIRLHPVLLAPLEPLLSPADEVWRADFVTALGTALGAQVEPPVRDAGGATPRPASVPVPPVTSLASPTPTPRCGSGGRCVVDGVAFAPDTSRLVDETSARATVGAFVVALPPGAPHRIGVVGYCAAFGDPVGARSLSRDRATVIAHLLTAAGVDPDLLDVAGVGFDRPAEPARPAQDAAQRVVVLTVQPH